MNNLLSIFSFDTLHVSGKLTDVVTSAFVLCCVCIVGAELALRVMVPADVRPHGSWHNSELRDQARQLEGMDKVDLMFVGSSITAVNVPPVAFDKRMADLGVRFRSFNAGIRGCNYSCIVPGFKRMFWSPEQSASVAIIIAPDDLNEANSFVKGRSQDFIDTFDMPALRAWSLDAFGKMYLLGSRAEIKAFARDGEWWKANAWVTEQGHVDMGDEGRRHGTSTYGFDADGPIVRVLSGFIEELVSDGTRVLLIEGPSDSGTWGLVSSEEKDEFYAIVNELATMGNTVFVPIDPIRPGDEKFIDGLHLNTEAAADFAASLAELLHKQGMFTP